MSESKDNFGRLQQSIAHHSLLLAFLETVMQLINVSRDVILREYEQYERAVLNAEKDNILATGKALTGHPHSLEGFDNALACAIGLLASHPDNFKYVKTASTSAGEIIIKHLVERMQSLTEGATDESDNH
jgi:hypothetical protein